MKEVKMTDAEKEKLKMLCKIRDLTHRLIDLKKTEISDEKLVPLRESLNRAYDEFGEKFGIVSSRETAKLFGDDSDYPIVKSLECYDKENENYQKADIFSKRTVNPVAEIKSVETAEEALQVSLDRKGKSELVHDFFCQLVHIEFYSSVGCRFVQIQVLFTSCIHHVKFAYHQRIAYIAPA